MPRNPTSLLAFAALAAVTAARAEPVRTGPEAMGDWCGDAPGVVRLIRPSDLGKPYETRSRSNGASVASRPAGAVPRGPEGTAVAVFAAGLSSPRILRTAPNGDVFVSESGAGRIRVLRPAADGAAPTASEVFASGLEQPFGIALWPPGPSARYVYVGDTGRVVR